MKTEKALVRSGGTLVDTVDVQVFDSTEEAIEALGETVVLGLVNAQHRANITNAARAKATEGERQKLSEIAKKVAKLTPEQREALGL